MMFAKNWPVCPATNDRFTSYASVERKDENNRVKCPVCCKVVTLQKRNDKWANTIPHHHATPNLENLRRKAVNDGL